MSHNTSHYAAPTPPSRPHHTPADIPAKVAHIDPHLRASTGPSGAPMPEIRPPRTVTCPSAHRIAPLVRHFDENQRGTEVSNPPRKINLKFVQFENCIYLCKRT